MRMKPINNRIVVKVLEGDKTTESGIVLTKALSEKSVQGQVVSISHEGEVKLNDVVVFEMKDTTLARIDGEEFVVLKEEDILGVLET